MRMPQGSSVQPPSRGAANRAGDTMTKTLRSPLEGTPANTEEKTELCPREVREKAGLEISEMADAMGMGEYGYGAWERGIRQPGGPAFQLLKVINANPDQILPELQK